jgi:hypothetical protein
MAGKMPDECQIECHVECQMGCPRICQLERQKNCQKMFDGMPDWMPDRMTDECQIVRHMKCYTFVSQNASASARKNVKTNIGQNGG